MKEVEIKQYAAQMVIRERFATDLAKKVLDTLYVERILEKKNMQWGFQHYWCLKMVRSWRRPKLEKEWVDQYPCVV